MRVFNIDYRRVGGMTFLKIGRLTLSWSISSEFKPLGADTAAKAEARKAKREAARQRIAGKAWSWGYRAGTLSARPYSSTARVDHLEH